MTNPEPLSGGAAERRRTSRRLTSREHGIVQARVRAGQEAAVLNVSTGGALIETIHRLLPGAPIELHLATLHSRAAVRGRVVRCAVSTVEAAVVRYQGAVSFDRHLPWFADDEARTAPAGTTCLSFSHGEAATRHVR